MRQEPKEKWHPPHIGQRILKTSIAVFLCLLVYRLRGYQGQDMPTEAAITAIICMQPYVRDSREYALNRLTGTLIGAAWGLLFLLLLLLFPVLGTNAVLLYAQMALGVLVALYTAVLLRKPDVSGLAAIVFICVVIAFPEIDQPLRNAAIRIGGVLLGTFIAIGVNVFRLPRSKRRDRVFFVRTKDLVPDRFSHLSSAALFRLNYLYNDGAKICLMSEHAPAFFMLQMSEARLSVPMIVMDGAAIYDVNENRYLAVRMIPRLSCTWLEKELDSLGLSYFIYTIHRNHTCVFHRGELNESEALLYERLRRSPYRSYLEGEIYEEAEIVYFKIVDQKERVEELAAQLEPWLAEHFLRAAIRAASIGKGVYGLYFYASDATMQSAEERLMELLRDEDPALEPVEIFSRAPYRSEHDAMHLLHVLGNAYEPLRFLPEKKEKEKE